MNEQPNGDFAKLAAALAKAQGQFPTVPKTGNNPHLGNHYATLDDIIAAVRQPLSANGLSFVQLLASGENGELWLRTMLLHESGQTISSEIVIGITGENRGVNALQALGSSVTYMKRYTLGAMLGIATGEDTDGEGAVQGKRQPAPKQAPKQATEQAPATNGKGTKPASIKANGWKAAGIALAAELPYYQDANGKPDWFHMTGAAGKLGYAEITDQNLDEVVVDLRQYAIDNAALAAQDAETA